MALTPASSRGGTFSGGVVASEITAPDFKASGLTGAVAASRYAGATASGAPAAGTFAVGDFVIDQSGALWVCTAAGTPGTWASASGAGVASVAAGGTEVVIGGTATNPTVRTGTLDVIATNRPPAAAVAMNAKKITGLAVATAATDAASLANTLDQFGAPAANVAFNAKKITGLAVATAATDAASLANTLDQFGAPAADVSMASHKLTNVTTPAASGDAATKGYVDGRFPATRALLVVLDTPDASGNGFPALSTGNGFTNVRRVVPALINALDGTWEGNIVVPADYGSAGTIRVSGVCNANTGAVRLRVSTSVIANGASEDTAYTDEAFVNHTVPGTALLRDDVTFTLSTTPVAGRTLNVKVTRQGTNGGDTLAVAYLLWDVSFEYTPL